MSQRRLIWTAEAVEDVRAALGRRNDKAGLQRCISQHVLSVARTLAIATKHQGPGDYWMYRFSCPDGEVMVPWQAVFDVLTDEEIALVRCATIQF